MRVMAALPVLNIQAKVTAENGTRSATTVNRQSEIDFDGLLVEKVGKFGGFCFSEPTILGSINVKFTIITKAIKKLDKILNNLLLFQYLTRPSEENRLK